MIRNRYDTKLKCYYLLFLCILWCFLLFACNQNNQCKWQFEGIEGKLVEKVSGPQMSKQVDTGSIVEVKGIFRPNKCISPTVGINDIMLKGTSKEGNKKKSWAVPLIGVGIYGNYNFPESIIKGALSAKIKTGEGYELRRDEEGGPAILTLFGKDNEIYLAFVIPANPEEKLMLNFGGSKSAFKMKSK